MPRKRFLFCHKIEETRMSAQPSLELFSNAEKEHFGRVALQAADRLIIAAQPNLDQASKAPGVPLGVSLKREEMMMQMFRHMYTS